MLKSKVKAFFVFCAIAITLCACGAPNETPAYLGPSPSPEIAVFHEPIIENKVRELLNKENGDITTNELLTIKKIFIMANIKDIRDLAMLKNLEEAYLESYQLSDLSPLKDLTNLRILWLTDCDIVDVSPLQNLYNLEELWLSKNHFLEDISPLSGLTKLKDFNITYTSVKDISCLQNMDLLEWFSARYIYDMTDFSPLKGKTNLIFLDLFETAISDIEVLKTLTSLKELVIYNTLITEAQYEELREALPDCNITWGDDFLEGHDFLK